MTPPPGTLLIGHPRSGTTLLRRLLDAHPDIAAPPELHLFGACARFLRSERNAAGLDIGALSGLAFAGFAEEQVLASLRAFAFGFLDDYAARQGKTRWVEKTAFDVFELAGIEQLCGDSVNYLGIVRHPVDVARSTMAFCEDMGRFPAVLQPYLARQPDPFLAFLTSWADTTRALMDLGRRRPERVTLCRYEDLVEAPEEMLANILAAIGAEPFEGMGRLGGTDTLGLSDHRSFAGNRVEPGRSHAGQLEPERLAAAAPIVGALMEEFGYPPLPPAVRPSQAEARRAYMLGLAAQRSQK